MYRLDLELLCSSASPWCRMGVNTKAADGEQTQTEGGGSGGLLSTVTIEPR